MDSITQAVLGAGVAAFIAPKEFRKRALLAGAILGTLPDLDILIHHSNDLDRFVEHRGFSHSLFVLSILPLALMPLFARFFKNISKARLYFLIGLPLITHPLLDSLTSYGTQLFYPLKTTPIFISSIFIVDFLYTSWLLIGVFFYLYSEKFRWINSLALFISCAYLVFGLSMQQVAKNQLIKAYPESKKNDWFVGALTASPFCWHGVLVKEDLYIETAFNIFNPSFMPAQTYEIIKKSDYPKSPALEKLLWFNPKSVLRQKGEQLLTSDLRMGEFGYYNFEFIIKPDKKAGQGLGWGKKDKWQVKFQNKAYDEYEKRMSEEKQNMLKQKLNQFGRCLKGGI